MKHNAAGEINLLNCGLLFNDDIINLNFFEGVNYTFAKLLSVLLQNEKWQTNY